MDRGGGEGTYWKLGEHGPEKAVLTDPNLSTVSCEPMKDRERALNVKYSYYSDITVPKQNKWSAA